MPADPISLLVTAGPTHEPIDAVRFIGNRSSGRMGAAIADAAAARAWRVTLLLGPAPAAPSSKSVRIVRFTTAEQLAALLDERLPECDALVMAAAVADYRPAQNPSTSPLSMTKIPRADGGLTLRLEPTPDLLERAASSRRSDQVFVGFALEPRERLLESATSKLARKSLDLIVANPLEAMDAPDVEATLLRAHAGGAPVAEPLAPMPKESFAPILLDRIAEILGDKRQARGNNRDP